MQPTGTRFVDSIYINEVEFTDYFISFRIIKKLNQMGSFEIKLLDIRSGDQSNVQQGKIVKIFIDNNLLLKGRIETVEYESEFECTIKGYDMSCDLLHRDVGTTRRDHSTGVATNTLVGNLCSENYDNASPWIMNKGTNDITETIYIRFEMINRLKALDAIAKHTGGEWWISNGGSGNHEFPFNDDYFNISSTKGTGTSLHTFNLSGASQNCTLCKRERDMENLINDIIVLGYGDGVNQIEATSSDATSISTYGKRQKTYVDRTLVASASAAAIADDIIANQKDPIERITIQLEDVYDFVDRQAMRMTVDVGDTVTIVDTDTNLNSTFKIHGFEYTNDPEYGSKMILECSEKKLTMLEELEETRKNVENLDVFMQGSTVCWNLSEKENLDDAEDLNMRFYLPSHIIKVNRAELSFQISDFRAYIDATQTSAGGSAHSHSVTTKTTGSGQSHSHDITGQTTTADDPAHSHSIGTMHDDWVSGTSAYVGDTSASYHSEHSHSITGQTTVAESTHTHGIAAFTTVSETAHTHDITTAYGINEDPQNGKSIDVWIEHPDGSSASVGTAYSSNQASIDIASTINYATEGAGWYNIKFEANKNARIESNLYLQFFIESQ